MHGWRKTLRWLLDGGAIAIFPAGNVARFDWRRRAVADLPWTTHVAAVARRTGAGVLPVYFHGHNSWAAQVAGVLCPPLYDLLRLAETNNKLRRTVRATVGQVIQPEVLSGFASDEEATAFLRTQTEKLALP